ncbi:hypothetical protein IAQ61_004066 [Plenodomus lingam]|uniref:uncharacterized protein n=1 Tax=Leptosphaeria maculans TaxID=5022 RepID=UPI00331B1994|nr:hypothetical protein IAQ61_004066 [Plenodomus lingam]
MANPMNPNMLTQDLIPQSPNPTNQIYSSRPTTIPINHQPNSPLLHLPAELRNKIYTLIFHTLPILVCFATSHASRPVDHCPASRTVKRRYSHVHYSRVDLALLQTCRWIYFEARLLPFLLNTFKGFPEAMVAAFPGRLYHAQWSCVTRIELTVAKTDVEGRRSEPGVDLDMSLTVIDQLMAIESS